MAIERADQTPTEFVGRAKRRDQQAWATLYDQYYPILYRFAYAKLRSREEAEDVASQVFLEALKSIDRYNHGDRPMLAWFFGIARNLLLERLRSQRRASRAMASLTGTARVIPGPDTFIERMDILEALKHLTGDQQDVIILTYFLSRTVSEASQIMGRKENAIYALQFRALKALRQHLTQEQVTWVARSTASRRASLAVMRALRDSA